MKNRYLITLTLPFLALSLLVSTQQSQADIAGEIIGDCNNNGIVDILDVNRARDHLFDNDGTYPARCDANQNGELEVSDLTCTALIAAGENCRTANAQSPLGTNLDKIINYASEYPFLNAMKSASHWVPIDANFQTVVADVDLDDDGYPTFLPDCAANPDEAYCYVRSFMFTDLGTHYLGGRYVVTHAGTGQLGFGGDASIIDWDFESRYVVDIDPASPGGSVVITLLQTDPADPVHDIRIVPEMYESSTSVFHPDFIDSIESYRTIRYMDWMRTNWQNGAPADRFLETAGEGAEVGKALADFDRSREVNGSLPRNQPASTHLPWADRPLPSHVRYSTEDGAPVEVMVALANETETDPWFNMPHQADDFYVTAFATLVRDTLEPTRHIYVEYSNEIWNDVFDQGGWIEAAGEAEYGLGDPTMREDTIRYNYFGQRLGEMCDIWKGVFGDQRDRVICVAGSHAANGGAGFILEQILDCPLAGGGCGTNVGAVAIAPYIGARLGEGVNESTVENWSLDDLFEQMANGGVLTPTARSELSIAADNVALWSSEAAARNLSLVAYEGGQHLAGVGSVANNTAITDLFTSANREVRMESLYLDYLDVWRVNGGDLFVHFMSTSPYTRFGSWGAQEFYDSTDTPKVDAINQWIVANPCYWYECERLSTDDMISAEVLIPSLPASLNEHTIEVESNNHNLSGIAFTLRFNPAETEFVTYTPTYNPATFDTTLEIDHVNGIVAIELTDKTAGLSLIEDGTLMTIEWNVLSPNGTSITFSNPASGLGMGHPTTCSDNYGLPIPCANSGQTFLGVPTAVDLTTSEAGESSLNGLLLILLSAMILITAYFYMQPISKKA